MQQANGKHRGKSSSWDFTMFGHHFQESFEECRLLSRLPKGGDFPTGHIAIQRTDRKSVV